MTIEKYEFEPDLSRAQTPPASWYLDPEALARENETIFGATWQLAGHTDQVREPGDYFTCTVSNEPLVVARGMDGVVRAFSNVCRHRAGPVARGSGSRKSLQCAYHGWTYGMDGALLTTPEFEGVQCFERSQVRLPEVRVATWAPFVFVNLKASAPDLTDVLGTIPEETRHLPLGRMRLFKKVDYEVACNWKVYVDNYLEGYHIPLVHPGLFREIDYSAYRVETGAYHSKQHAPVRRKASDDSLYRRNLKEGVEPEALYYWMFPNLMLNLYPDNLQTNVILPLGHDRTLTRFEWFVSDEHRPGLEAEFARSYAFSDEVQREDIAICEAVQRGLRSSTYRSGRYSVQRENGLHHFHGLLSRFFGGPGAPG
jgi:choline monooxygenase